MKKIALALTASLLLFGTSCKKKEEKKIEEKPAVEEAGYQVSSEGSKVTWTGYKFTEKKGVSGTFKTINVINAPKGKTPIEAFNGVDFSIPVSSIFSDNAIRDGKLQNLFFGIMENTNLLTGYFSTQGEKIFLNLKMNNTLKRIPLTYTVADRNVRLQGTLNILDFGASKAFESIHKACEILHTGEDGVSKTWEEVAIDALVYLKK